MNLTNFVKYGIMNIVRKRKSSVGQYLPLYTSKVFTNNQTASQRFKQFLPTNILNYTGFYQQKYLTVKLQFNPESQTLRIVTVRPRGLHTQQFDINNILPWSYRDMIAMSKWPEPTLAPFLDDQMVYVNKILRQAYIFESDGSWNEQTIKHPKLSLQSRLNQSEWFDRWTML